jgi:pimeloyl-ACP methyl ester carboxylesterase
MVQVEGVGLHVGVSGQGPDVVVLTGGPGCVQYLERDELAPTDHRAWYPEPRGVGRSGGGPPTMERTIDFWSTHPDMWKKTVTDACSAFSPPTGCPQR